jgi:hypothetical protein
MDLIAALPQLLGMGSAGLLAFAIATVVRGDWIPKISHDKMIAQQREGYEAIITQYKASLESQGKEIARLQARNEEFVNLTLTGSLITTKVLELATRKSNEHNPPTGGG